MSDAEVERELAALLCPDRWFIINGDLYWRPEAAGYTKEPTRAGIYTEAETKRRGCGSRSTPEIRAEKCPPPPYTSCANAVATAREALSEAERPVFLRELTHQTGIELFSPTARTLWSLLSSTPSQQSRAILAVLRNRKP